MNIAPTNAYSRWMNLYGNQPPHNVTAVFRMIKRWNIKTIYDIPERLLTDDKLGPVTFNNRLAILRRFSKWCLKKKLIKYDITEDLNTRKAIKTSSSKREPYSDRQIQAILEALYAKPYTRKYYYPYVKFMLLTGVRNGEAAGLKIGNVDFEGEYILIDKSYSRKYNGTYKLKSTKTASGVRYIPLTPQIKEIIEPLCTKGPDHFVFRSRYGKPIHNRNFQKRIFKPLLKKLNIPERDLYACRHTFGTIAVEQNIDILSIAYLMGHSKPRTVLDHYAKIRNRPKTLPKIPGVSYKD